ncbi:MAG: hypothetical protein K9N46_05455 [Candidatus Marinimicrobia bacterium]|nr:hypothetical protein [Candidatus Neomarinimicrobiota bacterium]MCF7880169.1 hypothetical protein [Candidatus Neomarinimicrobiota bacterium]
MTDFPKKYQWPASKLSREDMQMLVRERKKTGKPITVLIRDAVHSLYGDQP